MQKSAIFSDDKVYRYELRRVWDESKGLVCLIGLNPSSADEQRDDNTICKCIKYAQSWGYGGLIMVNLFAYILTDPATLRDKRAPVGPDNLRYVLDACREARVVVGMWSTYKIARVQALALLEALDKEGINVKCLKQTKPGEPHHLLYLPAHLTPIEFKR